MTIDSLAHGRLAWPLAVIAGGLLPLAFAPIGFWPAALISPAILFWLWLNNPGGRAAGLGYVHAFGSFLVGASWVQVSFIQFGGMDVFLSTAGMLLFFVIIASYYAGVVWLAHRWLTDASHWRLLAIYPAAWVIAEWLRGFVLTGFNWLNLGSGNIDTVLAGWAPLGGGYAMSLAMALSAGALLALMLGHTRSLAAGLMVTVWGGGAALQRVDWVEPVGEPLSVALVQGNIAQADKWKGSMRWPTLELYERLTMASDARVVIWPETAVPAYAHQVEATFLRPLEKQLSEQGRSLLTGVPRYEAEDGQYFNAMLAIGADGRGIYDKRHLVPYGEYLPMKAVLADLFSFLQIPMSDFSAGDRDQTPVTLGGHPIGISICYEDAYGRETIDALPAAAYLVNASNDAWFGDSLAPHQHLEIARMRALETGRYLLRATNTGISAIIGPYGEVISRTPQFEQAVLEGAIQPMAGATPYVYVGDWWLLVLPLGMLLLREGKRCCHE